MPQNFTDDQLGQIVVRLNVRARRIIMRPQADGVKVTIPPNTSADTLMKTLDRFRDELHKRQQSIRRSMTEKEGEGKKLIDLDFQIKNDIVTLTIDSGTRNVFYSNSKPGETTIICPPDTQFDTPECQEWLHRVIEKALRQQASWLLPERLRALSVLHDLPFNRCKVNVSKGRWGSCSTRKDINLSCYLMLLPSHLREYVMLHELCHTREMNHGPRFWELLDSLTGGRAKELRNELKAYRTEVW